MKEEAKMDEEKQIEASELASVEKEAHGLSDVVQFVRRQPRAKQLIIAAIAIVAVIACLAGVRFLAGSVDAEPVPTNPILNTADTSEGVAATVNGAEIGEKAITAYVQDFRERQGLLDEEDWCLWVVDNGYGFESLRNEVLTSYVNQELMLQAAERNGVKVGKSQIDAEVAKMRALFDSDEEWLAALSQTGMNEDYYRNFVRMGLVEDGLVEALGKNCTVDDDEVLETVARYAAYYPHAKRSSQILFASDEMDEAEDVLARIEAGELTFEAAAEKYSKDIDSAYNGGDIGWDCFATPDADYAAVLAKLSAGQTSGAVRTPTGIIIVRCTDELDVQDTVASLDQVSAGFSGSVRKMLVDDKKREAYVSYMADFRDAAAIHKNPIPSGLPYVFDLEPYLQPSGESDVADEGSGE